MAFSSLLAWLWWLLAWALLVGLLCSWIVSWARRRYAIPERSEAVYFVNTHDGARLALHRYPAPPSERLPVVLCPGLAANRFQFDLDGKSLAQHLSQKGFDVWTLEPRGVGASLAPQDKQAAIFDDLVESDLPAAIARVLRETKAPALHWVGASTGALAAMIYAARTGDAAQIASIVAVGSPTRFVDQPNLRRFTAVGWLLSYFGTVRLSWVAALFSPLGGRMNPRLIKSVMNRDNLEAADLRRGLASATADISRDALRQYADWVHEDELRSMDRRIDYRALLPKLRAPLLVIMGSADILAPASSVDELLENIASPQKARRVAGTASGLSAEYGHADLFYGKEAPREIFPWVSAWLEGERP
jgi:pimeloyl-ACP methyl ester carboxylesterase